MAYFVPPVFMIDTINDWILEKKYTFFVDKFLHEYWDEDS